MELAIDTAGDMVGVGISDEGVARAELRWAAPRMQGAQLLPAIDHALRRTAVDKRDLTALFVCLGPGSYMGVRAGVATTQGLAEALGLPVAGVGRLALDAWVHRAYDGPIVAVHRAGRSEWAWAAYRWQDDEWQELTAPRLSPPSVLANQAPPGALLCGEPDDGLIAEVRPARHVVGQSATRRPAGLCELGWQRLQAQGADDPIAMQPIYLREPAIGPVLSPAEGPQA
jgi:tRNA threonylcarbamoyladenosine biosynthesis protein TsaB